MWVGAWIFIYFHPCPNLAGPQFKMWQACCKDGISGDWCALKGKQVRLGLWREKLRPEREVAHSRIQYTKNLSTSVACTGFSSESTSSAWANHNNFTNLYNITNLKQGFFGIMPRILTIIPLREKSKVDQCPCFFPSCSWFNVYMVSFAISSQQVKKEHLTTM